MRQSILIEETSKREFEDKLNHYLEKFQNVEIQYSHSCYPSDDFWGKEVQSIYSAIVIFDR